MEGDEAARIRCATPREGIAGAAGQLLRAARLGLGLGALAQREVRLGERDPGPAFRPYVAVPGRARRHGPGGRLVGGGERPGIRRHLGEQKEIGGLADDPRRADRGPADEPEQPRGLLRPRRTGPGPGPSRRAGGRRRGPGRGRAASGRPDTGGRASAGPGRDTRSAAGPRPRRARTRAARERRTGGRGAAVGPCGGSGRRQSGRAHRRPPARQAGSGSAVPGHRAARPRRRTRRRRMRPRRCPGRRACGRRAAPAGRAARRATGAPGGRGR